MVTRQPGGSKSSSAPKSNKSQHDRCSTVVDCPKIIDSSVVPHPKRLASLTLAPFRKLCLYKEFRSMWPNQTITQLTQNADCIRRRPFGVIEVIDGEFSRIVLRPWPKLISIPEVWLLGHWRHGHQSGDRIRLYYNQPWQFPNFLTLQYAESTRNTSYRTLSRAMAVLDEVARWKKSDALLCEITNSRITSAVACRWGWEPHCLQSQGAHYIKRFYGTYPPTPAWLAAILAPESLTPEPLTPAIDGSEHRLTKSSV
jgi:hypothetical protein